MAAVRTKRNKALFAGAIVWSLLTTTALTEETALKDYVKAPDLAFQWTLLQTRKNNGALVSRLRLVSQKWHNGLWEHELILVRPKEVRNPDVALLLIGGSGGNGDQIALLRALAEEAGALTVLVSDIPNQPLFGGRVEDALVAYSFVQYLKTQDASWPLLFPMVKSAVRALDAVQDFAGERYDQKITRFVVGGASKRGWTTWLTAAVDSRVVAIAPMVFDMLNMKAQTDWARKVYGRQSEQIHDYTEANLVAQIDEPEMKKLRSWIDPYSYRSKYTMPKLILLGTNDPYWTVDSLRHYWAELPGPKLIHQTPNAGHSWSGGVQTLAAFFQMVADRDPLPTFQWSIQRDGDGAVVNVRSSEGMKRARLWTAVSQDRDFRNDRWTSKPLRLDSESSATAEINSPASGYRAFLIEAEFVSPGGRPYRLSTEARVVPDGE